MKVAILNDSFSLSLLSALNVLNYQKMRPNRVKFGESFTWMAVIDKSSEISFPDNVLMIVSLDGSGGLQKAPFYISEANTFNVT